MPKTVPVVILAFDSTEAEFAPYWERPKGPFDPLALPDMPGLMAATVRSRKVTATALDTLTYENLAQAPETTPDRDVSVFNILDVLNKTHHYRKFEAIKGRCQVDGTTLMICCHGFENDTDFGYCVSGGGKQGVKYDHLAALIAALTQERKGGISIILSICYAARTESYRRDHSSLTPFAPILLKTSFAYKFGKSLFEQVRLPLRITARTGALAFDYLTGASLVLTEETIAATHRYAELRKEITEVEETNARGLGIGDMMGLKAEAARMRKLANPVPTLGKHGKWIFYFGDEGESVQSKYTHETVDLG